MARTFKKAYYVSERNKFLYNNILIILNGCYQTNNGTLNGPFELLEYFDFDAILKRIFNLWDSSEIFDDLTKFEQLFVSFLIHEYFLKLKSVGINNFDTQKFKKKLDLMMNYRKNNILDLMMNNQKDLIDSTKESTMFMMNNLD